MLKGFVHIRMPIELTSRLYTEPVGLTAGPRIGGAG